MRLLRTAILRPAIITFVGLITCFTVARAQMPVLKVDDKETTDVYLKSLKIEVKVVGNIASTTMEMVFSNKTGRILEGELVFPLPEGCTVSRYALDINGRMREAVPVEKTKGTQVFEAIEHRRVDPGLLEKVEGNNFRTRIYPIPGNGSRTIIIGYDEELPLNDKSSLRFHLPLDYKKPIDLFSLQVHVLESALAPVVEEKPDGDFSFREWNRDFNASIEKTNYTPGRSLSFSIPKSNEQAEVMLQEAGGNYYFLINTYPRKGMKDKIQPQKIALLWDASLSGLGRDTEKELALLDSYLKKLSRVQVELVVFSNRISSRQSFSVINGDWGSLKQAIQNIIYDGGTQYSALNLPSIPADEYLLFSDGLSTFGSSEPVLANKPVYTITTAAKADYAYLSYLAQRTGGTFINLGAQKLEEAKKLLLFQPLQFIGIKPNASVSETYPSLATPVVNNFSLAGILSDANTTLILQFGYGTTVVMEKTITLNAATQKTTQVNLRRLWAQKKINELDIQYEKNKTLITLLGKQYSLVTRNTSLIVLENIMDYVNYDIEPPEELRAEYDRIMKSRITSLQTQQQVALANAFRYTEMLMNWWAVDIKPVEAAPPAKESQPTLTVSRFDSSNTGTIVTGRVLDKDGNPIPGATVRYKGARDGVTTTAEGTFRISKKDNRFNTLQISSVGYQMGEFNIGNSNQIEARLPLAEQSLSEVVVVTGYATKRKRAVNKKANASAKEVEEARRPSPAPPAPERALTASNQVVNADMMDKTMEGRAAGVEVRANRGADNFGHDLNADGRKDNMNASGSKDPKASINIKQWTPDRVYLQAIKKVSTEKQYSTYLELRKEYIGTPAFYYDMANFFLAEKQETTATRILSNIAELELENHELYKLLGFKLREMGLYDAAVFTFKKVLDWRPQEPQSYRDYGLALADAGKYQNALDTMYTALQKNYDANISSLFPGIEEIIVTEINNLVSLHGKKLDVSKIDRKLLHNMPVDVRVVLSWNMSDTDIDLWVTDPANERCYYGHKQTTAGGRISQDFTRGYGPEQFMIKKAIKGNYKIEVNYYGNSRFKIAGPATVMAEVFTHYADGRQERKFISLQMDGNASKTVLVGEFSFK
jgi:tetratricopeptide (TPR) repeat protein